MSRFVRVMSPLGRNRRIVHCKADNLCEGALCCVVVDIRHAGHSFVLW